MATIQRNILIRDRLNVKQNAKPQPRSRRTADAVAPGVIGIRAVNPSTVGTAEKRRLAKLGVIANQAVVIARGLDAIIKARDSAEASGVPELNKLVALATGPRMAALINKAVDHLAEQADSILREQNAASNDDPEHLDHTGTFNTPTEGDPSAASGMDAAQITRIRHARFSTEMDVAEARGAFNPARVAAGLDDVPDDVYAFMGDPDKSTSK